MSKKILLVCCLFCFIWDVFAQGHIENQSALTQQYLTSPLDQPNESENPKFVYSKIKDKEYVNAFVKVTNEIEQEELENLGVLIGTKAGDIWTIKIPTESLQEFILIDNGIKYVELDQPVYTNLEAARTKTNVNQVHDGVDLPQTFTGKDVIVGVLDVGFDYTHPSFYSADGSTNRIKRIWEQKSTGTPPAAYSYGHEIIDTMEMIMQQTDNPEASHGSHVAGIAAGSGFGGVGNEYRGVAYESDLVLVGITPAQSQWVNTGMTDIIDGLNYIFEYASFVGKPAVANLSWGCSIGPHDGSSLFSQAVNNLTGEGKILTVSAGNNGDRNLHLHKEFNDTDTILRSFINWNSGLPDKKTWIDVWGDAGESFCVDLRTYKGPNVSSTTNFVCLNNATIDTFLIGSDDDTVFVKLTSMVDGLNGKPHAFFDIHSTTKDLVAVSVKGTRGNVHVWMGYVLETRGYYNEFVTFGFPEATAGDDQYTVGEMACTESAISVGAYASKVNFTNIDGQGLSYATYVDEDDIVPFSSVGPTTDGRMKPDIVAPGLTLASAVNSFDANYLPSGSNYNSVVHKYTDASTAHDYYYGESSGTSMSAPMVAGIVALILEARPTATPEEIKTLLANSALLDEHTTENPDPTIWGAGKIDAYAVMLTLFASGVDEKYLEEVLIYPNPTTDILNIDVEGIKSIQLTNMMGELCLTARSNDNQISLQDMIPGIYIMTLFDENNKIVAQQRVMKY